MSTDSILEETHCRYELSPRPKVVNLTLLKTVGGNLLESSLFQKMREFLGISPWPVVEMRNITSVYWVRDFCGTDVSLASYS